MKNSDESSFLLIECIPASFFCFCKKFGYKILFVAVLCGFYGFLEGKKERKFSNLIRIPMEEGETLRDPVSIESACVELFGSEKWSIDFAKSFSSKSRKNTPFSEEKLVEVAAFVSSEAFLDKTPTPSWIDIDGQDVSFHFVGISKNFYKFVLFTKEPGSFFSVTKNIVDSINDIIVNYNEFKLYTIEKNREIKYDQFTKKIEELLVQYKRYQKEDKLLSVDVFRLEKLKRNILLFEKESGTRPEPYSPDGKKKEMIDFIASEKAIPKIFELQKSLLFHEEKRALQKKISYLYSKNLMTKTFLDEAHMELALIEDEQEYLYARNLRKTSILEEIQTTLSKRDSQFSALIERERFFIPRLDFSEESFFKFNRRNQLDISSSKVTLYVISSFFVGLLSISFLFAFIEIIFGIRRRCFNLERL